MTEPSLRRLETFAQNRADGSEVSVQRQAEALERFALLGLRQRRAADSAAYKFFTSGKLPDQEWLDLLKLSAMSTEIQQKVVRHLVEEGLVALSAILCEAFLQCGTSPRLLVATYATNLHYLGFCERALAILRESGLMARDLGVLDVAVRLLVDCENYDEARELLASASIGREAKSKLLKQVNAVDAVLAELGRLPHGVENKVFVVNLLQDIHRWHAVTGRLHRLNIQHIVVKGMRVDDIPEHLAPLLRIQRKRDLDGSFGNQLSQYGIWKTVATGTAYGVILEDDAFVRYRGLGQLSFADLAPGADIIFLNDRLAPAMTSNEDGQIGLDRLEDVLVTLSFRMDRADALGSDGYVLSPSGAEKLLRIAETEGFHSAGTDWYLVCHSFDYRRIQELNPESKIAEVLRTWSARVQNLGAGRLTGVVVKPALVEHRPLGAWRDTRVYL